MALSAVAIFTAAYFLVEQTAYFSELLRIPPSIIGLLVLSIGTNVPELAIALRAMAPGTPMTLEGPFGDLVLPERTDRPVVFLAGGIGVTPFYSMARDAAHRSLPHKITLIFSNRRPEDAPFLKELVALPAENPNFTFVGTMTDMEKSSLSWEGERGYVDAAMLSRYVNAADRPIYYLAGPPGMVAAMRTMLNGSGVSNDDIRTEEFSGY